MQDFKGCGKEYEFHSKHDGKSLDRVELGNNRGSDSCSKISHREKGLKENTRILLAWVQAGDNDALDWEGDSGDR